MVLGVILSGLKGIIYLCSGAQHRVSALQSVWTLAASSRKRVVAMGHQGNSPQFSAARLQKLLSSSILLEILEIIYFNVMLFI